VLGCSCGSALVTHSTGGYRLEQLPQGPPSFLGLHCRCQIISCAKLTGIIRRRTFCFLRRHSVHDLALRRRARLVAVTCCISISDTGALSAGMLYNMIKISSQQRGLRGPQKAFAVPKETRGLEHEQLKQGCCSVQSAGDNRCATTTTSAKLRNNELKQESAIS
jgi:hypothetical protein